VLRSSAGCGCGLAQSDAELAKNPEAEIGRRLVIPFQELTDRIASDMAGGPSGRGERFPMKNEMPCSCACCRAAAVRRAATKAKQAAAQTRLDAAAVVLDTARVAMDDLRSLLDELENAMHEGDEPYDSGNDVVRAFMTRQATPDWN
jgi:hypothetical protein